METASSEHAAHGRSSSSNPRGTLNFNPSRYAMGALPRILRMPRNDCFSSLANGHVLSSATPTTSMKPMAPMLHKSVDVITGRCCNSNSGDLAASAPTLFDILTCSPSFKEQPKSDTLTSNKSPQLGLPRTSTFRADKSAWMIKSACSECTPLATLQ